MFDKARTKSNLEDAGFDEDDLGNLLEGLETSKDAHPSVISLRTCPLPGTILPCMIRTSRGIARWRAYIGKVGPYKKFSK